MNLKRVYMQPMENYYHLQKPHNCLHLRPQKICLFVDSRDFRHTSVTPLLVISSPSKKLSPLATRTLSADIFVLLSRQVHIHRPLSSSLLHRTGFSSEKTVETLSIYIKVNAYTFRFHCSFLCGWRFFTKRSIYSTAWHKVDELRRSCNNASSSAFQEKQLKEKLREQAKHPDLTYLKALRFNVL